MDLEEKIVVFLQRRGASGALISEIMQDVDKPRHPVSLEDVTSALALAIQKGKVTRVDYDLYDVTAHVYFLRAQAPDHDAVLSKLTLVLGPFPERAQIRLTVMANFGPSLVATTVTLQQGLKG